MDMKKILQAIDGAAAQPVEGSNDMKKFLQVINEGANPHKVALPVQMAMNHYQSPKETKVKKESLFKKYFAEAEEQVTAELEAERAIKEQRLKQYARKIADRVLEGKESAREKWTKASNERDKKHSAREAEQAKLPKEKRSGAAIDALEKHLKTNEGWQDFNKVEPYAVCLAGKPVKKFDYYEQARRFHDNWKQKLYREGNKEKADKITLLPLGLDEGSENRADTITVDVPLLIRLLEYAREDAKTDMDLHNVAENLISLSSNGDTLTMMNYESIIPSDDVNSQEELPPTTN